MIHIGLFEGIGGFSLAAQWMGWETLVTCEINPFGQRVLKHYWPNAYHHGDIHTLTYDTIDNELSKRYGTHWRNDDIILTGGFPCQPYSVAGKRKGKEDERHLWPEMLRAIREIQPRYVVGENVAGLISWDGGLVFDEVQTDLENEGYEVWPYVFPACSVDAPHRRDRVWFIAYSDNTGADKRLRNNRDREEKDEGWKKQSQSESREINGVTTNPESQRSERAEPREQSEVSQQEQEQFRGGNCQNAAANTGLLGQAKRKQQTARTEQCDKEFITNAHSGRQPSQEHRQAQSGRVTETSIPGDWENFPTVSPIHIGDDGISDRLVDITFPKWRNEGIKSMGNAIVPQLALKIFKAIEQTK